jgi:glycosyltransferase involved in cell wall biosynthesis
VLLRDPVPPGATLPGQWWPPRLLDPNYLMRQIDWIDVLHVHFGMDAIPPAVLGDVVRILQAHHVPLVLTVHDLHNPHFVDSTDHLARLDVLVPAAAEVITLTQGAAGAISARWGRVATVLPHPHVLPIEVVGAARERHPEPVVGVHAKSLRANIDPIPVIDGLLSAGRPDWLLRLDVDDDSTSSPRAEELSQTRLDDLRSRGVDVRVHPRFTDAELLQYLHEVDVLVLPYRFGTHSGWLEACFDAGVCAVVPDCGFFHEQHDVPTYRCEAGVPDTATLRYAVGKAVDSIRAARPREDIGRRCARRNERTRVRRQTTGIYRRLLAEAAAA